MIKKLLAIMALLTSMAGYSISFTIDNINYTSTMDYEGMNSQGVGADDLICVTSSPNASGYLDFTDGVDYNGQHYRVVCINRNAFTGNKNITGIRINSSMTIGDNAFKDSGITGTLTIGEEVDGGNVIICKYAFANTGIDKIIFNFNTNQSVGQYAFSDCTNLSEVVYNGSHIQLSDYVYRGDMNLTSYDFPPNTTRVSTTSIYGTGITQLVVPAEATELWSVEGLPLKQLIIEGDDTPLVIKGKITTTTPPLDIVINRENPPTFESYGQQVPVVGQGMVTKDKDYYFPTQCDVTLAGAAALNADAYKSADGWEEMTDNITTGINSISNDNLQQTSPIYFNLQGAKVDADHITNGLYIKVEGNTSEKVVL